MILDPGFDLTLRPMKYPVFYEMFKTGIKNTWTVEEVDFSTDLQDLKGKLTPAEHHLIKRLVAFFATGDSIVGNNVVLALYKHINAPEARLYLSRQLFEEALHVQFYLTLLDNYIPDMKEREEAFAAINNISSIQMKAEFCFKHMEQMNGIDRLESDADMRTFLKNLCCFATCVEGLFFFGAFAYVYFLRSRGLLQGLAAGTNWVFRDESAHIEFALEVINTVKREKPHLWNKALEQELREMIEEAIECEFQFAQDTLGLGVAGMNAKEMREYLQYIGDRRLMQLGLEPIYGSKNPFGFMELQDVQELTNFFERRVSAYQVGVSGEVAFAEEF